MMPGSIAIVKDGFGGPGCCGGNAREARSPKNQPDLCSKAKKRSWQIFGRLRMNSTSGHGIGTPLSERVREDTEEFAFLFYEIGVKYRAEK
jgi:hypothetical protein